MLERLLMQNQIKKIDTRISEIEKIYQVTKDAMFKTKEALDRLNNDLATLRGERKALDEVRESLDKALEENKPKK